MVWCLHWSKNQPRQTEWTRKKQFTLHFVWPLLKSSPPMKTPWSEANSTKPGTKVFWGLPLIKAHCSKMAATAKSVLGAISACPCSTLRIKASAVSLTQLQATKKLYRLTAPESSVPCLQSTVPPAYPIGALPWNPACFGAKWCIAPTSCHSGRD